MQEYFNGVRVIEHDDGSTTHITYEHEPYTEPMTKKETAAVIGITTLLVAAPLMVTAGLVKWEEWSADRRKKRERQKSNKEIFDQIPN